MTDADRARNSDVGDAASTVRSTPSAADTDVPGRPDDEHARRARRQRRGERDRGPRRQLSLLRELVLLLVLALGLAIIIKSFFLQAFYVPSGSMEDTLLPNDRILVEKVSYWTGDVQRGDIVVFKDPGGWLTSAETQPTNVVQRALALVGLYPTGSGHLVKRVIGVAGDHVMCCDRQGDVEVNGVPLHERSYIRPGVAPSLEHFNVHVPKGHIWVMGDNRPDSFDSRRHLGDPGGGMVPVDDVVGKVFTIVWPPSRATILHRPATFEQPGLR